MSWDIDDFFGRRKKRRYPSFLDDFDELFNNLEAQMRETMKDFFEEAPETMIREKKNPDGSVTKEFGPFVYGYSMRIGPDGKPEVQEFGNVKPGLKPDGFGFQPRGHPQIAEAREPLVEVNDHGDELEVIAELPGVEKEDVKLKATPRILTIEVLSKDRKYYKRLDLPSDVDPNTAKSTYRNGVLVVVVKKITPGDQGHPIKVA